MKNLYASGGVEGFTARLACRHRASGEGCGKAAAGPRLRVVCWFWVEEALGVRGSGQGASARCVASRLPSVRVHV
eukprot:1908946-Prymnesium_polylepis.2